MPEKEDAVLYESIETNASGGGIPANGKRLGETVRHSCNADDHLLLAVLICFFFFFAFIMPCLCIFLARTLGRDDLRGPGSYKRRAIEDEGAGHKVV